MMQNLLLTIAFRCPKSHTCICIWCPQKAMPEASTVLKRQKLMYMMICLYKSYHLYMFIIIQSSQITRTCAITMKKTQLSTSAELWQDTTGTEANNSAAGSGSSGSSGLSNCSANAISASDFAKSSAKARCSASLAAPGFHQPGFSWNKGISLP